MRTDYDWMQKKAKKVLPLVVVAVLSVSLGCTAVAVVAAEDFGCACHFDISKNFETSLHHTGAGMMNEYAEEAAAEFGIDMDEYYEKWECAKCHATGCEDCHGEYGAQFPHTAIEDPSTNMSTCDKCHFKKQTSIFIGETPAHGNIPIEGDEVPHPADIHYQKGLTCTDCHTADEMHGTGVEYSTMFDAVNVSCEDCHNSPGKIVKNMSVTQYSSDIPSHEVHGDRLDCSACHTGWAPTCVNCHLDTRKGTKVVIDDFHLGIGADGEIKPFFKMDATYENETHTGYGEWFPHTTTREAKNCTFCHSNPEVLCDGREDQIILSEGGSFIPQEIIDWVLAMPQGIIDRVLGVEIP